MATATTHTLLTVVGKTPQIVTESIYAFKQKGIDITKLYIVTTAKNKANVVNSLLTPRRNGMSILDCLADEYALVPLEFCSKQVIVPVDEAKNPIADVRTPTDMTAMAQFLINLVKQLTQDQNMCLHASLAGGRKTMAFYLGYAMSIYGRPQDTLSHVFVDQAFEHSDFFYPPTEQSMVYTEQGAQDASQAQVSLVNVPYVQLRPSLPKKFLTSEVSFAETEKLHQVINAPLSLVLNPFDQSITCSGVKITLGPANFAFYQMMAKELFNTNEGFDCPPSNQPDPTMAILYLEQRLAIVGKEQQFTSLDKAIEHAELHLFDMKTSELNGLRQGIKASFFNDRKNQISNALRQELPEIVAEHYDIDSLSSQPRIGARKHVHFYGLNIEPKYVSWVE